MNIVAAADKVNDDQKTVVFDKVKEKFSSIKGMKFALWGLSFKPRTDDVREAPASYLIEKLTNEGAEVIAYDPIATETAQAYFKAPFTIADSALDACKDADALLIVTEWNEFRNPDFEAVKSALKVPLIFDGRNALNPNDVKKHGFEYYCVGRQSLFGDQ